MEQPAHYTYESHDSLQTEQYAEQMGTLLRGGEIIQLIGDVGAGKTTFVRGLARGMGSEDRVSSPTFTVSNVYQSKKLTMHHYDFYRIDDITVIQAELGEVIAEARTVIVLEWADAVEQVLPDGHITIRFATSDENDRSLAVTLPKKCNYLGAKS